MRRSVLIVFVLILLALPASVDAQSIDVDVILLVDTSASMIDDIDTLCAELSNIQSEIRALGLDERTHALAITESYKCVSDSVRTLIEDSQVADDEDWGIAIIELITEYDWQPSARRLIIVVSDAGPASGNPVEDPGPDREVTTQAIQAAANNNVILSVLINPPEPDIGELDQMRLAALARDMASATGGRVLVSSQPSDLPEAIVQLVSSSVETSAGLTAIAAAIRTPGKLSLDAALLTTNAVLAALLVIMFGLTAMLNDDTFGERESARLPTNRVTNFIRAMTGRIAGLSSTIATPSAWPIGNPSVRRIATAVILVALLALGALFASFLDPDYQSNTLRDVGTFLTMLVAIVVVNLVVFSSRKLAARSMNIASALRIRPSTLGLIVLSVLVSRTIGFLPGYLLGLPAILMLLTVRPVTDSSESAEQAIAIRPDQKQHLAVGRAAILGALGIALIAWFAALLFESLSGGLSASVESGITSAALSLVGGIESALLTIFLIGVQYALFDLLPIASTTGRAWFAHGKIVWGIAFGLVLFGALHTLLNPASTGTAALQRPGVQVLGAILATYSGITLVAWLLANESRIRRAQGLNRRSTLIAGVLMVTWLGTLACVVLTSLISTINTTTVLIVAAIAVVIGGALWFASRRRVESIE